MVCLIRQGVTDKQGCTDCTLKKKMEINCANIIHYSVQLIYAVAQNNDCATLN